MANPNMAEAERSNAVPAKKHFIFILKARDTFLHDATEEERKTMLGHVQHLSGLHKSGEMLMGGRYMTKPIAVLVVEAAEEKSARALVESDPGVKSNILSVEVHEFMLPFLAGRPGPQA